MMVAPWMTSALVVITTALGLHVFSRYSKSFTDPYLAGVIAHGVAFLVVILIYAYFSGFALPSKSTFKDYIPVILTGICLGVANLFVIVMYAQNAPLSVALPLVRFTPVVLGVIFGLMMFGEILTISKAIGIVLACISIFMIMR